MTKAKNENTLKFLKKDKSKINSYKKQIKNREK